MRAKTRKKSDYVEQTLEGDIDTLASLPASLLP